MHVADCGEFILISRATRVSLLSLSLTRNFRECFLPAIDNECQRDNLEIGDTLTLLDTDIFFFSPTIIFPCYGLA